MSKNNKVYINYKEILEKETVKFPKKNKKSLIILGS
jgi:hypothetical protein